MGRECSTRVKYEKCVEILVGKPEGKWPLGRLRCGWKDHIRMDHTKIWWEGADWIHPTQDRDQRRAFVNLQCALCGHVTCVHLHHEHGGSKILRNVGSLPHYYTAQQFRTLRREPPSRWKPQVSQRLYLAEVGRIKHF